MRHTDYPLPRGIFLHIGGTGTPSAQHRRSSDGSSRDWYEFITERLELPCSRIHNIQGNQFFCFICFSNSSAWGSPLHYNATNLSSFFLKMASKNMTAIPWGGFFNSRRKSGLCQIPMKAANTHVNRFNGLVSRTKRTSSKQPLRQEIGGTVGVRSVVHVQS